MLRLLSLISPARWASQRSGAKNYSEKMNGGPRKEGKRSYRWNRVLWVVTLNAEVGQVITSRKSYEEDKTLLSLTL